MQEKFKAWQACWIHGNGFVIKCPMENMKAMGGCMQHQHAVLTNYGETMDFLENNYLATSDKPLNFLNIIS